MADVAELRFWPCCSHAIDWSQDGIIALASEENVQLLFPNTVYYDKEQNTTSWQHTPLPVPWFTDEELPPKDPAPYPNYSVGEEISANLPVSIAWSAPGLAKHRRCALGVLTSGLNLSIWAADGKPTEQSSWRRMLILNDTLAEYFDKDGPRAEEQSVLTTGNYEKMRLRSRVRAFAWAPSIGATDNFGIIGTQLNWDPHIVALSTDDNQIVFVLIKSPATTFGHDDDWSAKVLAHVSLVPAADQTFSEMPTSIEDIFQQQRFISHIAWSPWTVFNGEYRSVLAYATNEDVRARVITYIDDGVEFGPEVVFATIDLRNNGAMKWSPRVFDDGKVFLVMFSHSGITCLTVSAIDASIISESSKNPDNRLDENSGIVWDHPASAPAHLHFSTYTNTARSLVSAMRVSEDGALVVLPPPNWREQINDSKALFSMQHELQGNVTSKVSGLCASPLRDFIATCYTLHPSDMLEYGPPANRRCTITIHGLRSFSRPSINFPHGHASAESVLFTIKKWLDNTIEDADQIPEFTDTVLKKLLEVYAPEHAVSPAPGGTTPSYNPQDLGQCVREFKHHAFLNPKSVADRYTTLLTTATSRTGPQPQAATLPRTLIAFRLATATSLLPDSITHATPFSTEILASHQQVIALIESLMTSPSTAPHDASDPPVAAASNDTCDYCDAPIPFTDLNTATCTNGHRFPRCGLSFLAVQAPRCLKRCAVCGTGFLGEEFVRAQDEEGDEARGGGNGSAGVEDVGGRREEGEERADETRGEGEVDAMDVDRMEQSPAGEEGMSREGEKTRGEKSTPVVSLARVLFLACDVCIYCGGKFM